MPAFERKHVRESTNDPIIAFLLVAYTAQQRVPVDERDPGFSATSVSLARR
jgi:hypothetical protein